MEKKTEFNEHIHVLRASGLHVQVKYGIIMALLLFSSVPIELLFIIRTTLCQNMC